MKQISLNQVRGLSPPFDVQVAEFAEAMKGWRAHQERVKQDEAAGVTGVDRHWPLKQPSANPLVESVFDDAGVVEFEIVDDTLEDRKKMLLASLKVAEDAAIAAVLPPAKARLFQLKESTARAKPEDERNDEEQRHIDVMDDLRRRAAAIELVAAQAESDIDDLTLESIDAYQLPTFR